MHSWNVGLFIRDYTTWHPKRLSHLFIYLFIHYKYFLKLSTFTRNCSCSFPLPCHPFYPVPSLRSHWLALFPVGALLEASAYRKPGACRVPPCLERLAWCMSCGQRGVWPGCYWGDDVKFADITFVSIWRQELKWILLCIGVCWTAGFVWSHSCTLLAKVSFSSRLLFNTPGGHQYSSITHLNSFGRNFYYCFKPLNMWYSLTQIILNMYDLYWPWLTAYVLQ
jgi:hypothetical protein